LTAEQAAERIFDIANQVNAGQAALSDGVDRVTVAELNLQVRRILLLRKDRPHCNGRAFVLGRRLQVDPGVAKFHACRACGAAALARYLQDLHGVHRAGAGRQAEVASLLAAFERVVAREARGDAGVGLLRHRQVLRLPGRVAIARPNQPVPTRLAQRLRTVEDAREAAVKGGLRCSDSDMLVAAASHGAGVVLVPDILVKAELERGELMRLLPAWEGPPQVTYLAYGSRRNQPMSTRKLVDYLVCWLRDDDGSRAPPGQLAPARPAALLNTGAQA
jgi:hypothetical protein